MPDMQWKKAIIKVLEESDSAMQPPEIAEIVVQQGLRKKVGATPADTVSSVFSTSLGEEGNSSPFVRVGRGLYGLRSKLESVPAYNKSNKHHPNTSPSQDRNIITAFGMYWHRESVFWKNSPQILGRQQVGADPVDLSTQRGVYLLYDRRDVIYVGRVTDRPLGQRLYEHTSDRLSGRWDRFSWFGTLEVTEDGKLVQGAGDFSIPQAITSFEAILIEGLEPPQNRRRGDDFGSIEFLQAEDPKIKQRQKKAILDEMAGNIS